MVTCPSGEIAALDKHREAHRTLFRVIELLIDTVVVPASWPVQQLAVAVKIIETLDARFAALCSGDARSADLSAWIDGRPGLLWLTIDIPNRYLHSWLDFATSEVTEPKVEGLGDLSLKHNLGVLLARLWGWHSVLFLDDDIDEVDEAAVWRGAAAVGVESMVGLSVDHFPDDSVACHVNWYSGGAQEILVSGLAPLVDCRQANSFFPEVYNEHWMFFRRGLVRRKVAATESVRQLECDPFADPDRAAKEEFGEVLAKGLTNLTHHSPGLELVALDLRDAAFHAEYWRWFLRARAEFIEKIGNRIANQPPSDASHSALLPLKVAHDRRSRLSTEQCAADLKTWESHTEDCGGGPLCSGPALFGRSWCLSASSSTRSRHSFDPA